MRNGMTYWCRQCLYRLSVQFTKREMSVQSILQSAINAFNSLGRSRKLVLLTLVGLALLYYLGPFIFRMGLRTQPQSGDEHKCLGPNLAEFQSRISNFDAFVIDDSTHHSPSKTKMAYVGNGKVAAALGSDNGLYIRKFRALSLPVKFWPVVQTHVEGQLEEAIVLDVRSGLAYKMQALSTASGCVYVGTQLYAHRSRPSLLVQDLRIQNPSAEPVVVVLDQIGDSGWTGVQIKSGSVVSNSGEKLQYKVYSGSVVVDGSDLIIPVAIATIVLDTTMIKVEARSTVKFHILTAVHYSQPLPAKEAPKYLPDLVLQSEGDLKNALKIDEKLLRQEHTRVWGKLWFSGFGISYSKASGSVNGDHINKTIYYVLSNAPAPMHDLSSTTEEKRTVEKVLYHPDRCYEGHTTLIADTLWIEPMDETQVSRVVTTWMITLEKQGCMVMVQSGAEGILQAMVLSLGPLHFHNQHLEMTSHPRDLHRDLHFRRINYGNNTHLNISVVVGDDNKATIFVALDRNDKPYYGCDAGCLDPPVPLSKDRHQFPVKLTDPVTSVLYITSDRQHMEELKHAIHVKEINEAPAHEHHVIALHRHGHHFGGLPTIFWVSIAFLIIVFHLFLFKLIYNEYCQGQDRFARSRYNL